MSKLSNAAPSRPDVHRGSEQPFAENGQPFAGPIRLFSAAGRPGDPLPLAEHVRRVGWLPDDVLDDLSRSPMHDDGLIDLVERSGLRGRGGAGFPTARKMRAVAAGRGRPIVVANGAEGEPASIKDVSLLGAAPHLVLDGAVVAAAAVGATEALVAVRRGAGFAQRAMEEAIVERAEAGIDPIPIRVFDLPDRYVAGEETALVRWLNGGPAKPAFTPPRPFQRGVRGRPTLVQNVETLAHLALIARFGDGWFRQVGLRDDPGSTLVTVSGAVERPGVYEVALGSRLSAVVAAAGSATEPAKAFLVGGFFGGWLSVDDSERALLTHGAAGGFPRLGCGVVAVLPESACPVKETVRILTYLASETADQCGPCVFGLPALAEAAAELDSGGGRRTRERLLRWSGQVEGRGACRHPDTAVGLVRSLLEVFRSEVAAHDGRGCRNMDGSTIVPVRQSIDEWR